MPSFKPTSGMVSEAKKGLEWRREYNRGGTAVGVARARDIANGRQLPIETVRRMHSYFSRHEVDKQGQGFSPGEPGFPSAGRIAWALWGGDAGQRWARRIVNQERKGVIDMEIRNHMEPVEVHGAGSGRLVATGYAARFETLSQNLGGFVEQIAPKSFNKTIKEADVRALYNHEPDMLLGRTSSGTLRLAVDSDGLTYEIDLPDTTVGRDLAVLLERGDITGSSFGFRVIADEWSETPDGFPLRTLKEVALRDVGPVTFPAYVESSSALRSLAEARSLDYDLVADAAAENKLSEVLNGLSLEEEERSEEDDRVTPIIVRRNPHLFR